MLIRYVFIYYQEKLLKSGKFSDFKLNAGRELLITARVHKLAGAYVQISPGEEGGEVKYRK